MNLGHGGNIGLLARRAGLPQAEVLDFSASINPLGPPEQLRSLVNRNLGAVVHYPDPHALPLATAIAVHHGIGEEQVVVGNGSTEILYALPYLLEGRRAVIPMPSYIDYRISAQRKGLAIDSVLLAETDGFALDWPAIEARLKGEEMVVVGQPNNPTGRMADNEALLAAADRHPSTLFVVDEAFADFIPGYHSLIHAQRANLVVVRSMTKFYAIPGLRLGYALADSALAGRLRAFLPPWSVGSLAQSVGIGVLADQAYAEATRREVVRLREALQRDLAELPGVRVFPATANYMLVKLTSGAMDAVALEEQLIGQGIAIRVCANFSGLDQRFFRVAVRTDQQNQVLVDALAHILKKPRATRTVKPRSKPAIMFLGTSSNAGKSVLTAAMCRILLQDGYRVAPFKAQNMSLNSHVTSDGGEMGRAQVVQAQACRLVPDVRMNPVLLKPNSDLGSQVIVLGRPLGNMVVDDYIQFKSRLFSEVKQAYDSLAAEVDVVVLEGAGSPAEVNLKSHDIVNLAMAEHARAAALLVGDIDRGGVFASFAGTLDLLSESERALIAGFVINRFRGQKDLLDSAVDILQCHTGLPTFGVVPYLSHLGLPEEDSVSFKSAPDLPPQTAGSQVVEIAVVDLPHISNFTDLDALTLEPDVQVRIVRRIADLGTPDALILPGSKNVIEDLIYLQSSGLADGIIAFANRTNTQLIGICGGLQILGERIEDPLGIESDKGSIKGLGLISAVTTLAREKSLQLVNARHLASGLALKGYEIHHGQTQSADVRAAVVRDDGQTIGLQSLDGRIWGTYLHGLFDQDPFRRWFVDCLRTARGWPPVGRIVAAYDLEPALDRLASTVREHIDLAAIYRKAGLA